MLIIQRRCNHNICNDDHNDILGGEKDKSNTARNLKYLDSVYFRVVLNS